MDTAGRMSLAGPDKISKVDLEEYRAETPRSASSCSISRAGLTKHYVAQPKCQAPAHVLFPQIMRDR